MSPPKPLPWESAGPEALTFLMKLAERLLAEPINETLRFDHSDEPIDTDSASLEARRSSIAAEGDPAKLEVLSARLR